MARLLAAHDLDQTCTTLAAALDRRSARRFAQLLGGSLLATGQRTVTAWIRAANLSHEFRRCYATLAAAGQHAAAIATTLLISLLQPLLRKLPRITLVLDDTPTRRVGPCVQGRGIHRNPTPGPAGSEYFSGHIWVTLAVLLTHRAWGTIAIPLWAKLYVRSCDLDGIDPEHRPAFQTKLTMAVDLLHWACERLKSWGSPIWLVVDGAYATAEVLAAAHARNVTVVSRLRKDAALFLPPEPRRSGQRGRPRKKGRERVSLAKRAAAAGGWSTESFSLYGSWQEKTYKTFVAYWRPADRVIRVVLVQESSGWRAFVCTDVEVSVETILELVADRFAIETMFRDVKQIVGAGQQQTRCHFANLGGFNVCLWSYAIAEAWSWSRRDAALTVHRAASPWDDAPRRPSHAEKRRAIRWELLGKQFEHIVGSGWNRTKYRRLAECLLNLAA